MKNYSDFKKEDRAILMRAVMRYRQGDDTAIDDICNLTKRYLWPIALHSATHQAVCNSGQTTDYHFAEDMLEKTLITIWQKLRTDLREPDKYLAWAKKILSNNFKNEYQKRDSEIYPSQSEDEEHSWDTVVHNIDRTQMEQFEIRERMTMVNTAMNQLDEKHQAIVYEYFIEGYKEREIAESHGIPLGTVKSRKNYGLEKLRKLLG